MTPPEQSASQQLVSTMQQALASESQRSREIHVKLSSEIDALKAQLLDRDRKIASLEKTALDVSKPMAQQQQDATRAAQCGDTKIGKRRPDKNGDITYYGAMTKRDYQWNVRFDELAAYKEERGHCNVTSSAGKYHALGLWVASQRDKHKQAMLGKGNLDPEKIRRLVAIGFSFIRQRIPGHNQFPFDERMRHLAEFKAKTGHCNVPSQNSNEDEWPKGLGNFVAEQRKYYNQRGTGKKNSLTQERIDRLDAVGFQW
eukprot:CAMPEP_0119024844 /NCGR_PEP_ID=MMETSP1176-20130426/32616_1 /TAXON_ID=265551 /ORGANISM="Synedropsis recta cf, Strain CCMP1620" /LENGTH=256 /DNA_ID=CAMNT_0006980247 /DNA_START=94 /DNA_END=861 /DNA_ORIENTATION=+